VPPALVQQLQQQDSPLIQQGSISNSSSSSSWCFTYDYSNGGPFFITQDRQLDIAALPGVQVLATYCALPDRHNLEPSKQQQQRLLQQQQFGTPACNTVTGIQAAAAVRCSVGSGVAVLCGTHPELEPQWLDVCGWSTERPRASTHGSTSAAVAQTVTTAAGSTAAAAAAAAPRSGDSSRSTQPALAVLDSMVAAGVPALQQQQEQQSTAAGSGSPSGAAVHRSLKFCEDVKLAQHTEALRRVLAASQEQRDLFLSCLLYEVLRRG
jgi:hypothetical protein